MCAFLWSVSALRHSIFHKILLKKKFFFSFSGCSISNERLKAEILWTLKSAESHYSCRSSEGVSDLFRLMFPDSEVASQFKCGETKCRYLLTFGIAPHFSELLRGTVKASDGFVLLFDESLNHKTQLKQMDFHVRFWNDSHEVETRFLTSEFLGHATAVDLQDKFHAVISEFGLKLSDMLQISMDGPNVNLNLIERMNCEMVDNHSVGLLRVGSCGLHVVHNAFRSGCEASHWDIESFLSASYTLFKDSPARREDYISVTGSTSFPPKFCSHRWLENKSVASKVIELLPNLEKYVKAVADKKIASPKNKSFEILKAGILVTPLLPCRLAFFSSVAAQLEPFLKKYQADKPLIPFLCDDLMAALKGLLDRFIKQDVLKECTTAQKLIQIDLKNVASQVNFSKVELGFQTERLLFKAKKLPSVSDGAVKDFRTECKEFLIAVAVKISEKSPLKYSLVRNLSCLHPNTLENKSASKAKMKRVLQCMQEAKRISDASCDQALQEYSLFLDSAEVVQGAKNFDPETERVDVWFFHALSDKTEFQVLWSVIKKLLLLSHGQATVERGFSFNKEAVADNLSQAALKARRIVIDHIKSVGGLQKVDISKKLIVSAAGAYGRYERYLIEQKSQKESEEKGLRRKHMEEELGTLKKKLKTAHDEERSLLLSADRLSFQAEEQRSFTLVERSNHLRLTAKDKKEEAAKLEENIQRLQADLKKIC